MTVLCPAGLPATTGAIQGIAAQGLMGQLTTQNVSSVARTTIDKAMRGKAVYVPGFLNQMLRRLGSLIPPALLARLIGKRWREAHRQREEPIPTPNLGGILSS